MLVGSVIVWIPDEMMIRIFLMISVLNAFLHPLLNLSPSKRIVGRMGFPALGSTSKPFNAVKNGPSESRNIESKSYWMQLSGHKNRAMCSFPCQRASHFVKIDDILNKWGLPHEFRSVFKSFCWLVHISAVIIPNKNSTSCEKYTSCVLKSKLFEI